jgi:hypothetical protein
MILELTTRIRFSHAITALILLLLIANVLLFHFSIDNENLLKKKSAAVPKLEDTLMEYQQVPCTNWANSSFIKVRMSLNDCTGSATRIVLFKDFDWSKVLNYSKIIGVNEMARSTEMGRKGKGKLPFWEETLSTRLQLFEKPHLFKINNTYVHRSLIHDENGYYYYQPDVGCRLNELEQPPKKIDISKAKRRYRRAIYLWQFWSENYYHFMIENYLRFFLAYHYLRVLNNEEDRKIDAILIQKSKYKGVNEDVFKLIGWGDVQLVDVYEEPIFVEELLSPQFSHCGSSTNYQSFVARYYLSSLLNLPDPKTIDPKELIILIIKRSGGDRFIANHDALVNAMKKEFPNENIVVFKEPFGLPETIKLFSKAKLIIAPHGAGESNMIFSLPGITKVIEVAPARRTGYFNEVFWNLANTWDIDFAMLQYQTQTVDINEVINYAKKALQK